MKNKTSRAGASRRGLDPKWDKVDTDWTIIAVREPCERTVKAYVRAADDIRGKPLDCLGSQVKVDGELWVQAVFAFQLRESPWTHIQPTANRVGWSTAEELAARIRAPILVYSYGDTAGAFGYQLFDKGQSVEEYFSCSLDEDRSELVAAGWQLSTDGQRRLRSSRLGAIDMNAPYVHKFPDQVARDLDLYIPCAAWDVHPKTGAAELNRPWKREDFEAAFLMLAKW